MTSVRIPSTLGKRRDTSIVLLEKPALDFTRSLRRKLDSDPDYLELNREYVVRRTREYVAGSGVQQGENLSDAEAIRMVLRVVTQLRAIEK